MRTLLLLPFLLLFASPSQNTAGSDEGSSVVVVSFKWSKSRQILETLAPAETSATNAPASAMIPANKNFQRNVRVNDPAGVRDPNADTIDGRAAALEKSVQDARTPQPKPVDGFAYRAKIQNASKKVIEIIFWEYQFTETANPSSMARRQFLCAVNIKPDKEKELQAFSLSGPSDVISASSLGNKPENLFQEKVVINRVEYADGSIWQRKGWNFAEVKASYDRVLREKWLPGMCKGL